MNTKKKRTKERFKIMNKTGLKDKTISLSLESNQYI